MNDTKIEMVMRNNTFEIDMDVHGMRLNLRARSDYKPSAYIHLMPKIDELLSELAMFDDVEMSLISKPGPGRAEIDTFDEWTNDAG